MEIERQPNHICKRCICVRDSKCNCWWRGH